LNPFVIDSPSQYRPAAPPALTSSAYTQDFNEVKTMGSATSLTRTPDETLYSQFWASTSASYLWDQITISLAADHHLTSSETGRLLALVNLAMSDAGIGCWDAKYHYVFWRPVTAIPLAATDGNPDTVADPTWVPLLVTPAFPEYPSGHSCASGAAARVLTNYFGNRVPFRVTSDGMPDVVRSFSSLSAATDEVKNARVFAGIHFRTACDVGQGLGVAVADHVWSHALLPEHGHKTKHDE
jgi:hypothetical protein